MCLQNLPRSQSPAPKKNELKIKPAKGGNAGKDGKERRSEAISLLFLFFAFPSRPLRARRSFPIRARLALIRAKRCDAVDWVQPKRADSAHLRPALRPVLSPRDKLLHFAIRYMKYIQPNQDGGQWYEVNSVHFF